MKVTAINLPSVRPTMPPYGIGILAQILKKIKNPSISINVVDLNLFFFDSMWSLDFDERATILSDKLIKENNIDLEGAKNTLKGNSNYSYEDYLLAIDRILIQSEILNRIYDVEISFGEVKLKDDTINHIVELAVNQEKNIYFDFLDKKIVEYEIITSDVVVLSIMCKEQLLSAFTLSYLIKKNNRSCYIILGGSFVERFINDLDKKHILNFFDFVSIGKAEQLFPQLIDSINNKSILNRIVTLNDFSVKDCEFQAEFFPYYGNIDVSEYYSFATVLPISTSRSCYYRGCMFCDNFASYSKTATNFLSPLKIIEMMKFFFREYGCRCFEFIDDCVHPKTIQTICKLLIKSNSHYKWSINLRFSPILLQDNFINDMYSAGCRLVFLGLESYSNQELQRMNKGIKTEWIIPTLEKFKEKGIITYISTMIGFPGQTKNDFELTKKFLFSNSDIIDLVDVNIFKLAKNSHLNKILTEKNLKYTQREIMKKINETRFKELHDWTIQNNKIPSYWNKSRCWFL